MIRQFCHLSSELGYGDWLPAVLLIPDSVERQHMPAGETYPSSDILVL
jgi:hypothetical protein